MQGIKQQEHKSIKQMKIAITMGDPSGIGPEIVLKSYWKGALDGSVVIGSKSVLEFYRKMFGMGDIIYSNANGELRDNTLNIIDLWDDFIPSTGKLSEKNGKMSFEYVKKAAELAKNKKIDAIVTLPINKLELNLAGFHYVGHTDFFSRFTEKETVMTMASSDLIVSLITDHVPLKYVTQNITKRRLVYTIETLHDALINYFGKKNPKIAVLGVNPHAGDGGVIGDCEMETIKPIIDNISYCDGPIVPDAAFSSENRAKYDGFVATYHDQGLIPFKMLHFSDGVNVTLGLPFIRTSVDHGTAYDIAGLGKANPQSFFTALNMAKDMINGKSEN